MIVFSPVFEGLSCDDCAGPDDYKCPELRLGNPSIPGLCVGDWRKIQRKDKSVARIIQTMEESKRFSRGEEGQNLLMFICY